MFMGDLNYRIEMGRKEYELMIKDRVNNEKEMNYWGMFGKEQLINQKALR